MPECRLCRKEIIFLRHHETGKSMPVDAEKTVGGGIIADRDLKTFRMVTPDELEKALLNRIPLYMSHFSTCPDAANFRRSK